MNFIRTSIGPILILGALAGCAGDDGVPPDATPPSPGQSPSRTVASPAPKMEPKTSNPAGQMEAAPTAGKKAEEAPKLEPPGKADAAKPTGATAKLAEKELAAIKELPQADQDAAIAQAVCPVSTHNLGSMGMPLKVTAEGRTFYICCDSCEDKVTTDGKAVVAKLDKMKAAK
jgi:hypothetical protein